MGVTCGNLIFTTLYNIPHYFDTFVAECYHPEFEVETLQVCPSQLRINEQYIMVYVTVMYSIFVAAGPLVILIILNSIIILSGCIQSQKKRQKLEEGIQKNHSPAHSHYLVTVKFNGHHENGAANQLSGVQQQNGDCQQLMSHVTLTTVDESNATPTEFPGDNDNMTLVLVVCLFIFCNSMSLGIGFIETSMEELTFLMNYLVDISNLLVVTNSSVNVLVNFAICATSMGILQIYYTFGHSFRRTLQWYIRNRVDDEAFV